MTCRLISGPDACARHATRTVTFVDGDRVAACEECALRLELQAQSFGTSVKVEKITR